MAKSKLKPQRDEEREERIRNEILVDCYNDVDAKVMSWHGYLEENLAFPFPATCTEKRPKSPLKVGDKVKVIKMAALEDCEQEMFVIINLKKDHLEVPLAQLEPLDADEEETLQAVEDWLYWVRMGYQF